jgi:hypothetical protein
MNEALAEKNRKEFLSEIDQFEAWLREVIELTGMNDILLSELQINVVYKFRSGFTPSDLADELMSRFNIQRRK